MSQSTRDVRIGRESNECSGVNLMRLISASWGVKTKVGSGRVSSSQDGNNYIHADVTQPVTHSLIMFSNRKAQEQKSAIG